jgi:hypothetical protein
MSTGFKKPPLKTYWGYKQERSNLKTKDYVKDWPELRPNP